MVPAFFNHFFHKQTPLLMLHSMPTRFCFVTLLSVQHRFTHSLFHIIRCPFLPFPVLSVVCFLFSFSSQKPDTQPSASSPAPSSVSPIPTQPMPPWRPAPTAGDRSLVHCCLDALHFMCLRDFRSHAKADYVELLVKWQLARMLSHDMTVRSSVTGSGE